MKKYMKGEIVEHDGRKYRFTGGDAKSWDSWQDVTETSTKKDIGLSVASGGLQGVMDVGHSAGKGVAKMLPFPINQLLDIGMERYRSLFPEWKPLTSEGRYAGSGVRGAVGSAPFGPMGALSGATAGLGGEAGSDLTGGSKWGRLIGSLVGGVAPNIPGLVGGLASRRIRTGVEGMTPDDWRTAQQAQQTAAQQGIQLTGPEAIGSRAPDLAAKQLMVEQHPRSAGIMGQLMSRRPEQVKGAVRGMLERTGHAVSDPALLGTDVQTAAKTAIDKARQAGNISAQGRYASAEQTRIPAHEWNTLTQNPVVLDALTKVKKNPYYGISAIEKEGSVRWLDAAKKYLDDIGETFSRGGQNYAATQAGKSAADVRGVADATSQDYAQARKIVEENIRQNVEPRQLSITGALAETRDPVVQFGRLSDPALSRPGVIAEAAKDIGPNYRQLVRHGLETQFDTAMKQLQSGGQQFGGARLARALRGTDQTRANIEATIKALPDGEKLLTGWNRLLDTLELTGNRLPVGSRTAFNQLQAADITGAGMLRQGLSTQPLGWLERVEQNISARNLAKIFTDPESVKRMHELAVTKPNTAAARAIVSGLLGARLTEE